MLKESRVAVEKELKSQSAVLVQNVEEATQHRVEIGALRSVCLCTITVDRHLYLSYLCLNMCHPKFQSSLIFHICLCVFVCVFRLLQEQMEQSLSDVQHRLSVKTSELQAAHQQIDKLEEKIGVCFSCSVALFVALIYSNAHLYVIIICSVSSFLFSLMHLCIRGVRSTVTSVLSQC